MKYSFNGFTQKANSALNNAITTAQSMGHVYVGSEHILASQPMEYFLCWRR